MSNDAFSAVQTMALQRAIKHLHQQIYAATKLTLEWDEALDLVTPIDERAFIRRVPMVACVRGARTDAEVTVDGVPLTLYRNIDIVGVWPLHPAIQPDASEQVMARIRSWIAERQRLSTLFGAAVELVDYLDRLCSTPKQVRYLWPCLATLCASQPDLETLGKQVQAFSKPGRVPTIPSPKLRELCRETSAIITSTSLIPKGGCLTDEERARVAVDVPPPIAFYVDGRKITPL